jgi:hypothetical protein
MKLAILGHRNSGKRTLAAYVNNIKNIEVILPDEKHLEKEHEDAYAQTVFDILKDKNGTLTKSVKIDKAVILVSSTDGPMPGTRKSIEMCKEYNISIAGLFITKTDELERLAKIEPDKYGRQGLLKMIKIESLELISSYGFDDTAIPVFEINFLSEWEKISGFFDKI